MVASSFFREIKGRLNKKWLFIVIITSVFLSLSGWLLVLLTSSFYDLKEMEAMKYASTIYDQKGKRVVRLGSDNHEYVRLDQIKTEMLVKALVAVEDRRFYDHSGVDSKGIMRAFTSNIKEAGKSEGGSTITMQLARNAVLHDREKKMSRKIKEMAVAWNLEREYTKDEILEAYVNYIYLGNQVRGLKMAAKVYFDKDITKEELSPAEVALLVGLPKAPEGYNPYTQPEQAKKRRNVVLGVMAEVGLITEAEKKRYQDVNLDVNKKYLSKHLRNNSYQAYQDYILLEAEQRYGISAQELASGGYQIHTGMNRKAQQAMEKAFANPDLFHNQKLLDGGATLIDAKTGRIAAIGGGRKYLHGYAIRALDKKQPGSSIKPITVYAPAIEEKGYSEYSIVPDRPYSIGNWQPKNYDKTYHGQVSLRTVAAKSINVATVWLLNEVVGKERGFAYAQKAGLNLDKADRSPAPLALGGLTRGVNTLQMAQAYSAFANDGKMVEAHAIVKITTADGQVVEPKKKIAEKRLFHSDTARQMTRILQYTVDYGTGRNGAIPGRPVAGKTGTTQNSKEAWFVGYTPEYVMAVMVYNEKGGTVRLTGGAYPARIFHYVMREALRDVPVQSFPAPSQKPTKRESFSPPSQRHERTQPEKPIDPPMQEVPKQEPPTDPSPPETPPQPEPSPPDPKPEPQPEPKPDPPPAEPPENQGGLEQKESTEAGKQRAFYRTLFLCVIKFLSECSFRSRSVMIK